MHIIGAGGHSRVIVDIIIKSNIKIDGVWDEDPDLLEFMGQKVLGNFEQFLKNDISDVIIAIGNNRIRKKLANDIKRNNAVAIHPSSSVSLSAQIGIGTVIMPNASVNAKATIGIYGVVNTNASVDHDCRIGDFVHIAPQVGIGGNVEIGEGTHIGIGASIIQGLTIGKWVTIGAGAVIVKDIPDFAVVVGNPGRVIKYNSP